MFCNNCGAQISEESTFCPICGAAADALIDTDPVIPMEEMYTPPKSSSGEVTLRKTVKRPNSFLVGLCCILAFAFTFSTFVSLLVRDSISPEKVEDVIDNVDVDEIIEVGGGQIEQFVNNTVSKNQMEEIIEESTIPDYVEDLANEYADYLLYGRAPEGIDGDEVEALMRENAHLVQRVSGYTLTEDDYAQINAFFDENAEKGFGIFAEDADKIPAMKAARKAISFPAVIGLGAMSLVMYLLIFLAKKRSFSALKNIGVILILACGIIILAVFLLGVTTNFVPDNAVREIADVFVYGLRESALNICGTGLVSGFVCYLVGAVAGKFSKIEYV